MDYLEILEKLQVASSNYNKAKRDKKTTELAKCRAMLKYRDEIRTLKKQKEYIRRVFETYKKVIYRAYLLENNPSKLPIPFEDYKVESNYDFAKKILEGFQWGTNDKFNPEDLFIVENKELGVIASLSRYWLMDYYKAVTDSRDVLQYTSKYYAQ